MPHVGPGERHRYLCREDLSGPSAEPSREEDRALEQSPEVTGEDSHDAAGDRLEIGQSRRFWE